MTAALTRYIDVAQLSLYIFWAFFAGLVFYLRREDKREGYPLTAEAVQRQTRGPIGGFPPIPPTKTFRTINHGSWPSPPAPIDGAIAARSAAMFPGAPLIPTGNPLVDGVGPASWVARSDEPDLTFKGDNRIVPMRHAREYHVSSLSHDPHGWAVIGADGVVAGYVRDLWIDESETNIRYLEVELDQALAADRHHVLVPEPYVRYLRRQKRVSVRAILAAQFADVPVLKHPDQVTFREEDRLVAYFGGGSLYATPARLGPLL